MGRTSGASVESATVRLEPRSGRRTSRSAGGSGLTDVVVVGSLTIDLTANCDVMPLAGETVLGSQFSMVPGGKGNNQAIA
ncbi:MAG: PfkB family carbohydrate kinase, partial [Candidatus Dormibacteria bacterium]